MNHYTNFCNTWAAALLQLHNFTNDRIYPTGQRRCRDGPTTTAVSLSIGLVVSLLSASASTLIDKKSI